MAHTIVSTTSTPSVAPAARHIPLWLKLAYTAFMAVLVPVYLRNYGPTNFLYFCDLALIIALIITLVGIWIESPLLVSICAVGVIASQTLWVIDFLSNLIDHPLTGLTQSEHPTDVRIGTSTRCLQPIGPSFLSFHGYPTLIHHIGGAFHRICEGVLVQRMHCECGSSASHDVWGDCAK
jgi:hypothetical protein